MGKSGKGKEMRRLILGMTLAGMLPLAAEPLLTFNPRPLGSVGEPLVVQSYFPDPGLEAAVFGHHQSGLVAAKYDPENGRDVKGEEKPVAGIAAGIGVNFGPQLSYVFDTVECRLLYAWQGGFMDFTPYWGNDKTGSRVSNNYTPQLVGNLFFLAAGKNPLCIDGKNLSELGAPQFLGYQLEKGVPRFIFKIGAHELRVIFRPSETPLSLTAEWSATPAAKLSWEEPGAAAVAGQGTLAVTTTGKLIKEYQGYKVNVDLTTPNVAAGETLFNSYGCSGCHSIDGSKGHGPSVGLIAGTSQPIEGSEKPVLVDTAYLIESITAPNAKVVKGYPPNYMPPFKLPEKEVLSLALYIQSLGKQPE
jgi:mono/diheme cytochrome c family protein